MADVGIQLSGLVAAAQKLRIVARDERRGAIVDKIQDMAMDIWALAHSIEEDISQCQGSVGVMGGRSELKTSQCKSLSIPGESLCSMHDTLNSVAMKITEIGG